MDPANQVNQVSAKLTIEPAKTSPSCPTEPRRATQAPFARRIRNETETMTGTVGLITEANHANEIITGGYADPVFIARELMREPYESRIGR